MNPNALGAAQGKIGERKRPCSRRLERLGGVVADQARRAFDVREAGRRPIDDADAVLDQAQQVFDLDGVAHQLAGRNVAPVRRLGEQNRRRLQGKGDRRRLLIVGRIAIAVGIREQSRRGHVGDGFLRRARSACDGAVEKRSGLVAEFERQAQKNLALRAGRERIAASQQVPVRASVERRIHAELVARDGVDGEVRRRTERRLEVVRDLQLA